MDEDRIILKNFLKRVQVKDVMTTPVITVHIYEDFSVVEEIFVKKRIRHLPVVNDDKEIIGIISHKDVYKRIAPRRSPDGKVVYRPDIVIDSDGYYEKEALNKYILNCVMAKDPAVLTLDDCLGAAIHLMAKNKFSCMPIVNEKKHVIGIITRIDILNYANNIYEG